MVPFWILVVSVGLFGAVTDVVLNQWSKTLSLNWFVLSAVMFIAFMIGLGTTMRLGATREYSMTIALLLVLLVNVAGVGVWDVLFGGAHFTLQQKLGGILAILAIICFELGKK